MAAEAAAVQPGVWQLECEDGRQVWNYVPASVEEMKEQQSLGRHFDLAKNPNCQDMYFRTAQLRKAGFQPLSAEQLVQLEAEAARLYPKDEGSQKAYMTAVKGAHFFSKLQVEDGHWPGDYGGPMFLMPGFIVACHFCGVEITPERRAAMILYLTNHQNPDGGWGIHIESPSTMFGTTLNYVSLRLLGLGADDARCVRARALMHSLGGAVAAPSWGKFWLAVMGVYDWSGVNSLSPEMWLLPDWLPIHPSKFWCHCRMVYLPMSYMFGVRGTVPETKLTHELRRELYVQPYETIVWSQYRNHCCPRDVYRGHSWILDVGHAVLNAGEQLLTRFPFNQLLRQRALKWMISYIHAEDLQTNWIDIGPVNKVLNMMACFHHDGAKSELFTKHLTRLKDYLWMSEDGMKMQGYNGSQLWDTAFTTVAMLENIDLARRFAPTLKSAYHYFDISQIPEDAPLGPQFYRHINKGAWPFSTQPHGWAISDCTGEALSAVCRLHESGLLSEEEKKINETRLCDAINIIVSFQNENGGWATYENQRGSAHLEMINPSEVFGDIIVDYSYVECSSSALQGVVNFRRLFPEHRKQELDTLLRRGTEYIKSKQRPDGSWLGSWAVCFTYAIWFSVDGLIAAGESPQSPCIQRACQFLLSKQNADGGWGESYLSCVKAEYVQHESSQIVHTAWALSTLARAQWPDRAPLDKAANFLASRQHANGDWPHESIVGVFNANCMITYMNYRNAFPLKALGRYVARYGSGSA